MQSRIYRVGDSRITLRFGDLTRSAAEVLVSSDDYYLSMGGGVSAALRRAAGSRLAADASKLVPARIGDVLVTSAGDLPAKYVFHAVTIGSDRDELEPAAIVRQATQRAMALLPSLGCSSIAFPAIGAGVASIPYQTVAAEMAAALVSALVDSPRSFDVELCLMDRFRTMQPEDFFVFFEQFAAHQLGLGHRDTPGGTRLEAPAATPTLDADQRAQAQRRHQVYTMLRHLDARRSALETQLIEVLGAMPGAADGRLATLKTQLDQVGELRRSYTAELEPDAVQRPPGARDSVFVSSTSTDLKAHRDAVRGTIERLQLRYVGMEDFAPESTAPADLIRRKVNESEAYLGILALRYGYVDPGTGLSMTELEYRQALASSKPMHMFVMDDRAPIVAGMVETDSVRFARLLEFKARVMKDHTCAMFTDPQDLATKAAAALRPAAA